MNSFEQARRILAKYIPKHGLTKQVYTLDRMVALMAALGNPQNRYPVVHVAGTSGKTSTAYYIASLLKASGHKTGLTVSPHVLQINERLQIGLVPLPEKEFCKELGFFIAAVEATGIKPTYFEIMIAFAYWYFAKAGVDYAVVEVGLGGKLDGTNIVTRADKTCVITDIGFDHMHILGNTLAEIAWQKAGIIKSGNHVFMNSQPREVESVVKKAADEQKAILHIINKTKTYEELPQFQQRNFGLAEEAVADVLRANKKTLTNKQIKNALHVTIPCRFEVINLADKTVVLDGAHNYQKLSALYDSVAQMYPAENVTTLASMIGKEEDVLKKSLSEIMGRSTETIFTTFKTEQDLPKSALDEREIASLVDSPIRYITNNRQALETALNSDSKVVVVTGSLYFVSVMRQVIAERC